MTPHLASPLVTPEADLAGPQRHGLVSAWLALLASAATLLMAAGGWVQWRNRTSPCPIDPQLRQACLRTRRFSAWLYGFSLLLLVVGAWFAFIAPWLAGAGEGS